MKKNFYNIFAMKEISKLTEILNKNVNKTYAKIFNNLCIDALKTIKNRKKIIFYGNGGSAAHAQHLATELTVRYQKNRRPFPSISLADNISTITAISNDFNFNKIFSRQIQAIGEKEDLAVALTTSGKSKNIIEAIKVSKKIGIKTYVICGNNGGLVRKINKNNLIINSKKTSIIQVIQIILGHAFCDFLEKNLS